MKQATSEYGHGQTVGNTSRAPVAIEARQACSANNSLATATVKCCRLGLYCITAMQFQQSPQQSTSIVPLSLCMLQPRG